MNGSITEKVLPDPGVPTTQVPRNVGLGCYLTY